ncbi:hypothetical protein LCGC14_1073530 [marine sediment metagenome]|uniref:Uncharacterized protein n=1 Tax=marine sediment metagenome TaxID=412755 RepID=A0A0F9Q0M2_9ZZZZ
MSFPQQILSKAKTKVIKSIIKIKQFNFAGREKVIGLFGKAKDIGRNRQTARRAGIGADTSCQIEKQILTDEIQNTEFLGFTIENYSKLFSYIASGKINIRIHKEDGRKKHQIFTVRFQRIVSISILFLRHSLDDNSSMNCQPLLLVLTYLQGQSLPWYNTLWRFHWNQILRDPND